MKRQIRENRNALGGAAPLLALVGVLVLLLVVPGALGAQEDATDADNSDAPRRVVFVDREGRVVEWTGDRSKSLPHELPFGDAATPDVIFFTEPEAHRELLVELLGGQGYLGAEVTDLTPELRRHFAAPADAGVLVSRVEPGSPAEVADIRVGDILTRLAAEPVDSRAAVSRFVRHRGEGDTAEVELYRDGRASTVTVTLAERPRQAVRVRAHANRTYELHTGEAAPPQGHDASAASEEALRRVYRYFSSDEWRRTVEGYEGQDWTEIEHRMREVEKRLRELEGELEKADPPPP